MVVAVASLVEHRLAHYSQSQDVMVDAVVHTRRDHNAGSWLYYQ